MLDSLRETLALPHRLPLRGFLSVGSLVTFGWLLTQDLVHPVVVYLFELYLTF
jgi:hypothetical protein